MRFVFVVISLCASISSATVSDFAELVKETSLQEKRLHKKLLHALQGSQRSIAESEVELESVDSPGLNELGPDEMVVRLVASTYDKKSKKP
ncbi:MAG: hypothetical protein HUU57_00245 [Bdellovibrio sp.]|nr:hypothetical protein [Bdellovibrio sp.]